MSATTLRLYGVVPESIVDGPGFRYTVFVQGCPHHCPGCHIPESHDFAGGYDRTVQSLFDEISQDPLLRGVTFSGGEPFCQPAALTELARLCRKKGLTVMAYSGWTYEELLEKHDSDIDALLSELDILVDGRFLLEQRNLELLFRGSENQRLIDMKKTRESGTVTLWHS